VLKKNKNKPGFIMDTDWLFQGILDAEQKEYILLSYFQKINQNLEELKIYPMFTDLSLHLGNIQTLLTKNQILYTNKNFYLNNLEELTFKDLKLKNIPQLTSEEYEEYQKILRSSQSKLFDYFNIAKAVWSIAYDSIQIKVVKNFKNTSSPIGFFYFEKDNQIYDILQNRVCHGCYVECIIRTACIKNVGKYCKKSYSLYFKIQQME
jgi:hypothetical protein